MNHADWLYVAAGVAALLLIGITASVMRRRRRKLKPEVCQSRWSEVQKYCADRKTWYKAVIAGDKLLEEALKAKGFKGKTAGERMVAAQRIFTDNESVWFGHKLRKKVTDEQQRKLSKMDTLEALSGFRQALKDLDLLHDKRIDTSPGDDRAEG